MMAAKSKALIVLVVVIGVILGTVPNAAAQVSVTSASPSSAAQGTMNLNVTISGTNFKAGASATFYRVDTTNTGGIVVTKTTYKRSSQLIATINVPETAERGSYDIKVTSGGTSATGRALFSVMPMAVPACTTDLPTPTPAPASWVDPGIPGVRDGNFGSAGVVIGPKFMEVTAVTTQTFVRADGTNEERIVTVGSSYDKCAGSDRVWTIARYLTDGRLDPEFGQNGVLTKAFAKGSGWLYAVAIDSQNRIVVGGYVHLGSSANYGAVARFSSDGVLDTGFAPDGLEPGVRSLSLERYMTEARAIVIQSDNKIVIGGTDGGAMAVFRLTENGAWDTATFNAGAERPQRPGRYVYLGGLPDLVHGPGWAYGVAIQNVSGQERIVVAGRVNVQRADESVDADGALWGVTMDGHLDSTFGTYGVVATDFYGEYDVFQAMALDGEGRIVVTGYATTGTPGYSPVEGVLVRYDANGNRDSGFGGTFRRIDPDPTHERWSWTHYPYALAIDSNGNFLVGDSSVHRDAGNATVAEGAGLWQFTPEGQIDTTFGMGGWIVDTLLTGAYGGTAVDGRYGTWYGLVRTRTDGKVVAAGKSTWGAYYPVLIRFWQ